MVKAATFAGMRAITQFTAPNPRNKTQKSNKSYQTTE